MTESINWDEVGTTFESFENIRVTRNVLLSELSRWKIGGVAKVVVEPVSKQAISAIIKLCVSNCWPYLIVGGTSNLLFCDEGIDAVLVKIGSALSQRKTEGNKIHVSAGCWVPGLARYSASRGLSGLEHTAGIPGTFGGLVCMNGGSQRKGIGECIVSVTAVMPDGSFKTYTREECNFGYRNSVFLVNGAIIVSAEIELKKGDVQSIRREMLGILKSRREKFPLKQANCGSVFASNPAMYSEVGPPGFAIEKVGLKGFAIGDAQISKSHANFFVNAGAAKSDDMKNLIETVRTVVEKHTGYSMRAEVRYVDVNGKITPL
jgi:UDP-N-acetylmuramate dehydrogenase